MRKLKIGVKTAIPVIQGDENVLIYCREGRHRSVAMSACILIGMGSSADEAMQLISEKRIAAVPYAKHIQSRIYKFEEEWNKGNVL
jgi:hypothetical protein